MANKVQAALELRKALQFWLETLDPETQAEKILEVPTMYPKFTVGKSYKTKDIFAYGENAVGDPQLYQVLQDHVSAEQWTPDTANSLYKAIGVTEDGYPEWAQPLGASDAYELGNIVSHKGKIWKCTEVGGGGVNSWEPGVFGWTEIS